MGEGFSGRQPWRRGAALHEDRPWSYTSKSFLAIRADQQTNWTDWTELREPVLFPFWKVQAQTIEQTSEVLQRLLGLSKAFTALRYLFICRTRGQAFKYVRQAFHP